MKKSLLIPKVHILFIFALLFFYGCKNPIEEGPEILRGWFVVNSLEEGYYNDMLFIDNNYGWISTNNSILRTSDGGETWQEYTFQHDNNSYFTIYSFHFIDSENGWACGENVYRTNDGGKSWTEVNTGYQTDFLEVFFVDKLTGYLFGTKNMNLKTEDGGKTWFLINEEIFELNPDKMKVTFLDNKTGYIKTIADIYRTTDGGISWPLLNKGGIHINDITFIDEKTGWIIGDYLMYNCYIYKTEDSGETWTEQIVLHDIDVVLKGIYFADKDNGWAVGVSGLIFNTTNGGDSWNAQDSGVSGFLFRVMFTDANTGWILGAINPENNKLCLMKTTNGGVAE